MYKVFVTIIKDDKFRQDMIHYISESCYSSGELPLKIAKQLFEDIDEAIDFPDYQPSIEDEEAE